VQLLEKREGTDAAHKIRTGMDRSLKHMTRLIEDLLDIARIDQGKISLKKEQIHLQEVIAFAVETAQPAIEAGRHSLRLTITSEPIWLEADPARVAQIIGNLLGNAAKYTPPGGEIGLVLRQEGDWAIMEVNDNGIGIAPEQQGRIFEIFEQVERSSQDGLGIGLALVRQLVDLHGGTIALARSAPNEGSTFEVRLRRLTESA
jgi:signal transduction histidine kinase